MAMKQPSTNGGEEARGWPTVPKRSLLGDETYVLIKDALTSNRIPPGEKLVIDSLARDLGVSITPVRHALSRLHSEGLVTQEPYKGFVASPLLDLATVAEIYDARRILETALISRAAHMLTPADLNFIVRAAEQEPLTPYTSEPDYPDSICQNFDEALHRRIAAAGGNQTLVDVLDGLAGRLRAYRAFQASQAISNGLVSPSRDAIEHAMEEHMAIVAALVLGDSDSAVDAMRQHLTASEKRFATPAD